ncbi:MAG: MBL fold metallo-hydrolase [Chloroflexi bacterium]|nr:MBL fold metallo-hydrolase [Chloroflexota bacterium]
MSLVVRRFVVGPLDTNAYLVADPVTRHAVVIDPGAEGAFLARRAADEGWHIRHIWITHAHFDHIGGAGELAEALPTWPLVAMHPDDIWLWRLEGGAPLFGFHIDPGPEPSVYLQHGQRLRLGQTVFEVRHAPGHSPGHVMFYVPDEHLLFAGDVIFYEGIGRTDIPGGDPEALQKSIATQVLSLPDSVRILPGHGPETTVGHERRYNPFLTFRP